jgi:O-antigen/teichoic acid export membrane protein
MTTDAPQQDDVAKRVVRGGAVRGGAFVLVNLLGAAGVVLLARALGVEDFGRYGTVLALVTLLAGATEAGLLITGSREMALAEPGEPRRALLGTMLAARLALALLAVVLCVLIALASSYSPAMLAGTVLAGLGAVLLAAQSALSLPLIVGLRNERLALLELAKQLALFLGIVALAVAGASLLPFLGLQVLVGLVAVGAALALVDRAELAGPRLRRDELARLVRVGLPVAVALTLTVVYVRLLVLMVATISDPDQTGFFVASARVVEMLGGLPLLVAGIILPVASVAARDDTARMSYVAARTTEVCLLLGLATALGVGLAAPTIAVVFGGTAFEGVDTVLRLQAPAIVTVFVLQSWVTLLVAGHAHRALVGAVLAGLAALVVAGAVLIPLFDAQGAAIAAVVADVVYAAATFRALSRIPGLEAPLHAGYALRALGCAAVALAAGIALLSVDDLLAGVVAALLFGGLAAAARLVPPEVARAVPGRG